MNKTPSPRPAEPEALPADNATVRIPVITPQMLARAAAEAPPAADAAPPAAPADAAPAGQLARRPALWQRIPADLIGDVLYRVGFWLEYVLLCVWRVVARLARMVGGYTAALLGALLRPLAQGAVALAQDVARPFVEPHKAGQTQADGTRPVAALVGSVLSVLMPVAAAAVLVLVVRAGMGMHFVLDVQVDGRSVGYVQSEQVFENARADVQSRLNNARVAMLAAGNSIADQRWEIEPTYALAVADDTMSETEIANALMRVSNNEIGEGTAVYVDDELRFVTTEGDHLRTYLENIKAPNEDALDPNTHVSFLHDIDLVDGVYMLSSIEPYSEVIDGFNADPEIYYYTAGANETAQTAVNNTGLSWDALAMMNPDLLSLEQEIPEGTQIVTGASSPELLKIKVIRRQSYVEDIPYQTQKSESKEYDFGRRVVLQEGETGQQEVTQDITYIDGKVVSTDIVSIDVLKEPVTQIEVIGTRLRSGMIAQVGTGSFMWPVPGYRGVSRWMGGGHTGADITANYGTPIVASDSGAVTVARNGAGTSYWSYGNYVQIDHGNGWTTLYAHMSSIAVSAGQTVSQGQVIGYVGSTGNSSGPHCHFEMRYNGALYSAYNIFGGRV